MNNNFDFESILVPYNATTGAERGLKAALKLAKRINGQITLMTCIENRPTLSFFKKDRNEKFEQEKKISEVNENLGLINPEKDIPIFFEIMLMNQNIQWSMPQRDWIILTLI